MPPAHRTPRAAGREPAAPLWRGGGAWSCRRLAGVRRSLLRSWRFRLRRWAQDPARPRHRAARSCRPCSYHELDFRDLQLVPVSDHRHPEPKSPWIILGASRIGDAFISQDQNHGGIFAHRLNRGGPDRSLGDRFGIFDHRGEIVCATLEIVLEFTGGAVEYPLDISLGIVEIQGRQVDHALSVGSDVRVGSLPFGYDGV